MNAGSPDRGNFVPHAGRSAPDADLIHGIESCAGVLLDERSGHDDLRSAASQLYRLLLTATGDADRSETLLACGKALSGRDAAHCVLDHLRTAKYLRAVDQALSDAAKRWPGQRLRVLYAGCGPWSPLLLMLAPRWSGRLAITLVDVHASSLHMAANLFAKIDQSAALAVVHCADACTLRIEDGQRPHVLIAEIMQRALEHEPQLAVTVHLAPQLMPGGILVPKRISVDAVLVRMSDELLSIETGPQSIGLGERATRATETRIPLAHLIEISQGTVPDLVRQIALNPTSLTAINAQVAAHTPSGLSVMLCTRIEVGPGLFLEEFESGITHPAYLHALGTVKPGDRLSFHYVLGARPGFACVWQSAPDADNQCGFTAPIERSVR
ncbi:MAG: hypothetical protein SGI99_18090 [Pseudomonadota bacterium]|nr:hypothetical protein [Pseudomonadota bacterium]